MNNKIFILCILLLFLFSCSQPGSGNNSGGSSNDGNNGGGDIPLEKPDAYKVTTLAATRLIYDDQIGLTWSTITDVDSYKVYRYKVKADNSGYEDRTEISDTDCTDGSCMDNSVTANTPYYYTVACVKDGTEYVESDYVFGLRSSVDDSFEVNDNRSDIEPQIGSTIFGAGDHSLLYSCKDGKSSYTTETDWYKYTTIIDNEDIIINVKLDSATQYSNGDVKLTFSVDGVEMKTENINPGITGTDCNYTYIGSSGKDIYYRIYVDPNCTIETIEKYTVTVGL
ncbi:MAG: hypothetical protein MJB14_10385 [Spirochaetes bacterium]|nr:hypothetical protein [Spirochaetota bacterium]